MADSTEEDKKATIKDIITRIDAISSDDTNTRALNFIDKYKLFEWDSDKTVEEGGHADQLPGTDRSKANSNTMSNIISAVDRIATLAQKHGIGFLIKPMGTEHSLIQKLLPGMTLCDPVYPDLSSKSKLYIRIKDMKPKQFMYQLIANTLNGYKVTSSHKFSEVA